MDGTPYSGRFTELLMEGLAHYRRGALEEAMASWEGAYHVEAGNPQAREFLRTALLRLQVKLGRDDGRAHPWLSDLEPQAPPPPPFWPGPATPSRRPATEEEPDDPSSREVEAGRERQLTALYEAALGGLHGQPRLLVPPERVLELALDSSTGFLLAQIDGNLTYEELFDISGLPRAQAAKILAGLVRGGVIGNEPYGDGGGSGRSRDEQGG